MGLALPIERPGGLVNPTGSIPTAESNLAAHRLVEAKTAITQWLNPWGLAYYMGSTEKIIESC